jgi:peptidoglycan/xylan/chitin deacetylase (PgdA/CDA1 family)
MNSKTTYITTSWDDGHPLDLRLAELLSKYDLPATFYIPLRNGREVLSSAQIREISTSFEIGGHTLNHCDLTSVPNEVGQREITECKHALEQMTGMPCTSFCFPLGHFRREHLKQVKKAGYRVSRTVELMSLAPPKLRDGTLLMPTTIQAVPAGLPTYIRNSMKRFRPLNLVRYLQCEKGDWVSTAEAVLGQALKAGGVFHFWGHSWEIEKHQAWKGVERVFAMLSQSRGRAVFGSNSSISGALANNH